MFCNKCGNELSPNQQFCNKCGNRVQYYNSTNGMPNGPIPNYNRNKNNTLKLGIPITIAVIFVIIVVAFFLILNANNQTDYYFAETNYNSNPISGSADTQHTTDYINQNKNKPNTNNQYVDTKNTITNTNSQNTATNTSSQNTVTNTSSQNTATNTNNQNTVTNTNDQNTSTDENKPKSKYTTSIVCDNVYKNISINSENDAYELIREDSTKQKGDDYPEEILQIENEIINDDSITAVNLKELDVDFAREVQEAVKTIYDEYPQAREYLTNLTLTNIGMRQSGVIAQFLPTFIFGTSNTRTGIPWIVKTQVQLNSSFFLNPKKIKKSIENSSKSGHFPANANRTSPIAHEIGHYLSFIALLNQHSMDSIVVVEDDELQEFYDIVRNFNDGIFTKQMLEEAYNNYLADNPDSSQDYISFDDWRGQISAYALAKDEYGEYIYDENIAEAFHDVYLNGDNANIASKYIVEVLRKYVGG